ncbi:MAG: VOC family protein [Phototrophicaceae bacterium]
MISHLSHTGIFVKDQDEALRFYTEKLGFELRDDMTIEGYRWLTVGAKGHPELELVLSALKPGGELNEEGVELYTRLQDNGQLGGGVLHTDDCRKTYEELKAKGVEFVRPPEEHPYGVEAVFKDNSGNWFSLVQPV